MEYISPQKRYLTKNYDFAMSFRNISMTIDDNPELIKEYYHLPAIEFLLSDIDSTTYQRTVYLEALSYGDAGVLLASPGPSLSGLFVREVCSSDTVESFYYDLKKHKQRTFFGLTELNHGSDATNIKSKINRISDDNYTLCGHKCFVGNVAVADIGVVIVREGDSIAGIRGVLLTPELLANKNIERKTLPFSVLRGASVGYIELDNINLTKNELLGAHLSATKRGFIAVINTFNKLRTGVGAIAIGQAQSILDYYIEINKKNSQSISKQISEFQTSLMLSRHMLHHAANQVDKGFADIATINIAKNHACETSIRIIEKIFKLFDIDIVIDNPWLYKVFRDRYCWTFMEGAPDVLMREVKEKINHHIKALT